MVNITARDDIFISVVIPAYNAERYIEETLNSVLAQTYPFFEIIIVENGSQDNTLSVLKKFKDERIKIFIEDRRGAASARNRGILESKGEWIAFLDADDIWLPEKLECQVRYIKSYPWVDLICANAVVFSPSGKEYIAINTPEAYLYKGQCSERELLKRLLRYNFAPTPTVVVRKSICEKVGFFREDLEVAEDYDLWIRLAAAGGRFLYLEQPLIKCRHHSSSLSSLNTEKVHRLRIEILKENLFYFPDLFTGSETKVLFSDIYTNFGRSYMNMNKTGLAVKNFIRSLYYRPWQWRSAFYIVFSVMPVSWRLGFKKIKERAKKCLIKTQGGVL